MRITGWLSLHGCLKRWAGKSFIDNLRIHAQDISAQDHRHTKNAINGMCTHSQQPALKGQSKLPTEWIPTPGNLYIRPHWQTRENTMHSMGYAPPRGCLQVRARVGALLNQET